MKRIVRKDRSIKIISFILIFSLTISMFSVYIIADDNIINNYVNIDFLNLNADDAINYANDFLINDVFIAKNIEKIQLYNEAGEIDWDMQIGKSPNTVSLYLHTLSPLFYLSRAYEINHNTAYIEAMNSMFLSWKEYNENTPQNEKNRYTWYDHTVALRTESLLTYLITVKKYNIKENQHVIENELKKHIENLADPDNYYENHNHGLMQDLSLLKAAYYFNDQNNINLSVERISRQLAFAFPNKFVHIENSTSYHVGMLSIMKQLYDFLLYMNHPFAHEVYTYYENALDFIVYFTLPNNNDPTIGDSIRINNRKIKYSGIDPTFANDNENLKYIYSNGREGKKPEDLTRIYKKDGYAILRENFDAESYNKSGWLLFKSGFNSTTHKHKDDLSIIYANKGEEIFIDPGMYNYMVGNKYHDYLNSSFAHNGIIIDNKSYPIANSIAYKAGIKEIVSTDNYEMIKGYNDLYEFASIERSIINIDLNTFIIVDDIKANEDHVYRQNFHLGKNIDVEKLNKDETILTINGTDFVVSMKQLNNVNKVTINSGDAESPDKMSVMGNNLGNIEESRTIYFEKKGSNERFITLIEVFDKNNETNFGNIEVKENTIKIEDIIINMESKIENINFIIGLYKNLFINIEKQANEDAEVVLSITDEKDGTEIFSEGFNDDKINIYLDDLTNIADRKEGKYSLWANIKFTNGIKNRKHVGNILYNNGVYNYDDDDLMGLPYISDKNHTNIENIHKFELEINNANHYLIVWYIYKNGASYTSASSKVSYTEFEINDPGEYVCIYRVYDANGNEFDYDHFSEFTIK